MTGQNNEIKEKILSVRSEIPDHVQILAAVKTRSLEEVQIAFDAGLKVFGHNYVQEALQMVESASFNAKWHMIGHLQRNKCKQAVEIFDLIESVDSLRLAKELEKRCGQIDKVMPVLIEVNSGREDNKTGVFPENVAEIVQFISTCQFLKLKGMMTMGPLTGDPELSRPYYKETRRLFEDVSRQRLENVEMKILSMGMSNSYKVAIEEGANLIRLGTSLFGSRKT